MIGMIKVISGLSRGTGFVEIQCRRVSLICISLFPPLTKLNALQNMPLVILYLFYVKNHIDFDVINKKVNLT